MIEKENKLHNVEEWVQKLCRQEMPVFSKTVAEVIIVAEKERSNSSEMARAVLQDASLTSSILKVANSAYYTSGRRRVTPPSRQNNIHTVTQAVLVLGFDMVRSMCQTKKVVEALLNGSQREQLKMKMADSFHAAVQARWLATSRKDISPEEIFIATLLYHLGAMAFWAFAEEPLIRKMESALLKPGYTPERAEMEVLGFRLQQLTLGLNREWHLGGLLEEALETIGDPDPRVENILLGHKLVQDIKQGWDDEKVNASMDLVGKLLKMPPESIAQKIRGNAVEAMHTAALYGATAASRLIPLPKETALKPSPDAEHASGEEALRSIFPSPDPMLQLKILREVSGLLLQPKPDHSLFLSMLMEGIYRGIGMDRILFALLSQNQKNLEAKSMLGWSTSHPIEGRISQILCGPPNIFHHVLETGEAKWITFDPGAEVLTLLTPDILTLTGHRPFFIVPVVVQNKAIGLIYADRAPSGRSLDEDSFASFQHFAQQINMGLSFIRQKDTSPN